MACYDFFQNMIINSYLPWFLNDTIIFTGDILQPNNYCKEFLSDMLTGMLYDVYFITKENKYKIKYFV